MCPENVFSMNGLPCDAGNGYCYNGQCPQKEDQCVKMYGPGRCPQKEDQCVKCVYRPGTVGVLIKGPMVCYFMDAYI